MHRIVNLLAILCVMATTVTAADAKPPVKIAIVGLSHDHAFGFIPQVLGHKEVELVGVVEADPELVAIYSKRFKLDAALFHPGLDELFASKQVQAVAVFTSTFEHRAVVERCADRKVDVMMEKPLAVNMEHARAIEAAAMRSNIQILVNYETSWYPSNHAAWQIVRERGEIGDIRRIVVNDGHRGPSEIGCSKHFLAWLTDPVKNGGGALNDFGCYGANLATWLMDGQRPLSVTATTRRIKPEIYPNVEDDATIIITYPQAQAVFQASWNWPCNRKDMEIYGRNGYLLVPDSQSLTLRPSERDQPKVLKAPPLTGPHADPVSYLAAVVRREISPSGLSSLSVNLTVVEILDAAHESARTGRRVDLPPK